MLFVARPDLHSLEQSLEGLLSDPNIMIILSLSFPPPRLRVRSFHRKTFATKMSSQYVMLVNEEEALYVPKERLFESSTGENWHALIAPPSVRVSAGDHALANVKKITLVLQACTPQRGRLTRPSSSSTTRM
jgi:hypothetical protein